MAKEMLSGKYFMNSGRMYGYFCYARYYYFRSSDSSQAL